MNSFNELLGFAALSVPLLLFLALIPVSIWIAVKISRRFRSGYPRLVGGMIVFMLIILMPILDEIAGRIYLHQLCSTEAGVKIYNTIILPAEYWNDQGNALFFTENGYLDHEFWVSNLDESGGEVERYSSVFFIDKDTSPIRKRDGKELLAEVINFRHWGGWVRRNLNVNNAADSCEFMNHPDFIRNLYRQLFISENTTD